MVAIEQRFALEAREVAEATPGLVRGDDGIVYLIEPDGTRSRVGGGTPPASKGYRYVESTGDEAKDSRNVQQAIDALPDSGGALVFDFGPYLLTDIDVDKPLAIHGNGPSQPTIPTSPGNVYKAVGTTISCGRDGSSVFHVNADGCLFERMFVSYTGEHEPTGSAFAFETMSKQWQMERVYVSGFYVNVDAVNGKTWSMSHCGNYDPVYAGLRVQDQENQDAGDMTIFDTIFYGGPNHLAPDSLFLWESGGGPKVLGCKFSTQGSALPVHALRFAPLEGIHTSVVVVTGNSIEDCGEGVRVESTGTAGRVYQVEITGNQISARNGGSGYPVVLAGASAANPVRYVEIAGNVLNGGGGGHGAAYSLSNCDDVRIGPNALAQSSQAFVFGGTITSLWLQGQGWSTAQRTAIPATSFRPGSWVFDTDLAKPLFADGTRWRDAAGTIV